MADLGLASASDNEVRDYAARIGAVIARIESELHAIVGALERGETIIEVV